MPNNKEIAQSVLEAVGGKDNVTQVTHCMTRLRFNLKDQNIPDDTVVKGIKGVLGVARSGGQYQIIIGQNVPKVYTEVCQLGGFAVKTAVEENLDGPKEKLTPKKVGSNIMNYLAGCMTPLLPVMMAASMFKTLMALLGPDFFGVISVESDLYILLDFLYDAGFYFMPVLVGFNAAQKLGVPPLLGAYMGCILIAPDLITLVNAGEPFTVFGIPCIMKDYSQTLLPIVLSVGVMSCVYKLVKKYMPDILSTIFTPFFTMLIMTPVSLCLLAPAGSVVGDFIGNALVAFGSFGGFVAVALVAALWELLVMSGMHLVFVMLMMNNLFTVGYIDGVCTAGCFATFAAFGVALGAFLRLKNVEDKSMSLGFFVSGILGGVTEPTLYGLCFKFKRTFIPLMLGGLVGGAYAGITHVAIYLMASTNILQVMGFVAGGITNTVNGCIACALSLITAAVTTFLFGFTKDELAIKN